MDKNENLYVIPPTPQIIYMHTIIRDKNSSRSNFIFYADRLIRILIEEALNKLPLVEKSIITQTEEMYRGLQPNDKICGVSIMRAGESMEKAIRDTCRGIKIGKILIQRDESTKDKQPDKKISYAKLPKDISKRKIFLLDPMLATGGSAIRASDILIQNHGVLEENIIFVNIIACQIGIDRLSKKYPKIKIVTSCIDPVLNEQKFIVPGLGDFGDRYFGT